MSFRRLLPCFGLTCLLMFLSGAAAAETLRTYTSEDGAFTFDYAPALTVQVQPELLSLQVGDFFIDPAQPIRVTVSLPQPAARFALNDAGTAPEEVVITRLNLWRQTAPAMAANVLPGAAAALTRSNTPASDLADLVQPVEANQRAGAYLIDSIPLDDDHAATVLLAAVDVGSGYMVTVTASASLAGGAALLESYQADILALIESMRYRPTVITWDVADTALPLTYTGTIGQLQVGELRFDYPKDWYILPVGSNILLTNTERLVTGLLEPGIMQVQIVPPDFNMTAFDSMDAVAACALAPQTLAEITPLTVIERQMLNPDRLEEIAQRGVTFEDPTAVDIAGVQGAYMYLYTAERDTLIIAVDMGGGDVVSLVANAYPGEMTAYDETLFAIAATLAYTGVDCVD
ncbi:MAG: hypothetical protein ACOCYT_02445 [Chloroflexota bacterium]